MKWRAFFQQLDREALTGRQIHEAFVEGDGPGVPTRVTLALLAGLVEDGVLVCSPMTECNPGLAWADAKVWKNDSFYALSPDCPIDFLVWMDT